MKKAVILVISVLIVVAGAGAMFRKRGGKMDKMRKTSDKYLALFLMMNQWVEVKQEGKNLSEYFKREGYQTIAVYGMGCAGQTLLGELRDTGVIVAYGIDKNAGSIICADADIVSMDDDLEPVDAVVVTAVTFFDEIKKELSGKIGCPVISLEDVLSEV